MKVFKTIIRLRYVVKENRTTDYYDVDRVWVLNIRKRSYYKIIWNKWFFNRRIVLFILKRN
jgi:hypothetical protein